MVFCDFFYVRGRDSGELFSLVDISTSMHVPTQKKNVVVDTIRLISGIPQSRMNDILSESEHYSLDEEEGEYFVD